MTVIKTIAIIAGIIIAPFAIITLICLLAIVIMPVIAFFNYIFSIEVDENGSIRECIGCKEYESIPEALSDGTSAKEYCENCKIYKKAQKIIAKRKSQEEKQKAEDAEQLRYLQEYNRKKREGKNE